MRSFFYGYGELSRNISFAVASSSDQNPDFTAITLQSNPKFSAN
jgi:hypothetical protein